MEILKRQIVQCSYKLSYFCQQLHFINFARIVSSIDRSKYNIHIAVLGYRVKNIYDLVVNLSCLNSVNHVYVYIYLPPCFNRHSYIYIKKKHL